MLKIIKNAIKYKYCHLRHKDDENNYFIIVINEFNNLIYTKCEKEMATHSSISCLENSVNRRAWWASVHGGHKELDITKQAHSTPYHLSVRKHSEIDTSML